MAQKENRALNMRSFSDILRDFMSMEAAEQKKAGGSLTSFQKIIEDALQKRYADKLGKKETKEAQDLGTIVKRAGLEGSDDFLGGL